jgi:hypothetical protein
MCLNCGCGEYWDKRGNSTNITMDDVEKAAQGERMKVEDTVKEMINGLNGALKQMRSRKR